MHTALEIEISCLCKTYRAALSVFLFNHQNKLVYLYTEIYVSTLLFLYEQTSEAISNYHPQSTYSQ